MNSVWWLGYGENMGGNSSRGLIDNWFSVHLRGNAYALVCILAFLSGPYHYGQDVRRVTIRSVQGDQS